MTFGLALLTAVWLLWMICRSPRPRKRRVRSDPAIRFWGTPHAAPNAGDYSSYVKPGAAFFDSASLAAF
jgi:hypothetical protein